MEFLRTPEERFAELPDYPFEAHYLSVSSGQGESLRLHYLDEGPADGPLILLLHGEPSWSYLYRKMIPPLVAAGYRTLVPDLIGFGKSDKPVEQAAYTYASHLAWVRSFLEQLDVQDMILFCQDWGGLLGLRIMAGWPERFRALIAANTMLPTGQTAVPKAFERWKTFTQTIAELPIGQIINMGTVSELPAEILAAYDAPFPDERYKAGARIFPMLVPTDSNEPEALNNRDAWRALRRWQKPVLTLFSDSDPITRGGEQVFQRLMPGAKEQPHVTIEEAGHFVQEDKGEELAQKMVEFLGAHHY